MLEGETRPSRMIILSAAYIILSVVNVILGKAEDLKTGCWLFLLASPSG